MTSNDENFRVYVVWSDYLSEIIGFASSLEIAFEMAAAEIRLQTPIEEVYGFLFIEEENEVDGTSFWTARDPDGIYEENHPMIVIHEEILDQPLINRSF